MAISKHLLSLAQKTMFNASEWKPVGNPVSLLELLDAQQPGLSKQITRAYAGDTMFPDGSIGERIFVEFSSGMVLEYPRSGKSTLVAGDEIDPSTITMQEIAKFGRENSARFDGTKKA